MLTRCHGVIVAEDLALDLRVLALERADLGAHVDRLLRGVRLERGDPLLELEQALLALDDHVHARRSVGAACTVPGAAARRARSTRRFGAEP